MERERLQLVRFASAFAGVEFEWDTKKNQANIRKHGVSFETASLVFYDPNIIYRSDEQHSDAEQRDIAIGAAGSVGVLFVVNTIRGDEEQEIIRIVSARPATKGERREYARANGATEA
jgi:uncharacterized DUF497 family protein